MSSRPVAGIDVGKHFSEMALLSPTNEIVGKMKIQHNSEDIGKAVKLLEKAEKDFDSSPVVVMESTGHYHKILFQSLTKAGFEVSVINPIQTDSIKNIEIRKVKNDKVDARRIALLYRFKSTRKTCIPDEDIECLRSLCRQYYILNDELTTYKNRLTAVVDQIMLNFKEVFPKIYKKTALDVLEQYPSPNHIIKADRRKLIALIEKTVNRKHDWAVKKYELLVEKAKEFAPLSVCNKANISMLRIYVRMVKSLQKAKDEILGALEELICTDSSTGMSNLSETLQLLCSIPGIGLITAATILAEIGSFSDFSDPGKLIAFCGIDPSVRQSGQFTGTKNRMSKRGSKVLRKVLYVSALVSIRNKCNGQPYNSILQHYYLEKCKSKPKKVALGAVMRKLVMIIFAVMRDMKPFEFRTPEEHSLIIKRNTQIA